MGIKGLRQFITDFKDKVFTAPTPIKGKLIIDGWSVLHELYPMNKIEWAFGGCYDRQHKATLQFYESLVRNGVQPIVIMEGGGSERFIEYAILKRSEKVKTISGTFRKQHETECKEYGSHQLPLLSWHVYMSSLRELQGIQFCIADGKAHTTIVKLANTYGCPVLTGGNPNYCISGVENGVIFIDDYNMETCSAPIFKQSELQKLLHFHNANLLIALVAIVGEYYSKLFPFLYKGEIESKFERVAKAKGMKLSEKQLYFKISDIFSACKFESYEDFVDNIKIFELSDKHCFDLKRNCSIAFENFNIPKSEFSFETLTTTSALQYLSSSELYIQKYRDGSFPDIVIDAVCVGKCVLSPDIGDTDQPPVQQIGRNVRRVMYGLALPMKERNIIEEYYRRSINEKLDYVPYKIQPMPICPHLMVDHIFHLEEHDQESRKSRAKEAIYKVLNMKRLEEFSGPLESKYLLGIITTIFWAKYIFKSKHLDDPIQLIKALVLNFLLSPEVMSIYQNQQYCYPKWIKIYHALLEWQSLYLDLCHLNAMLLYPFLELPPSNILYGSFVTELAMTSSSEKIIRYRDMLPQEQQLLYEKIIGHLSN